MNRMFLSLLFALAALCAEAAVKARYSGSRIFWDNRVPVIVFRGGGYARIIQLQDGRLMACCESGGIKVAYSSDMGKTWTAPRLIVNNVNNIPNCVPDLIQLKDGTIIVAYNPRPSRPYTEDRRFGIRLKRSTDNGVRWSDEIFVFDADYTFENGCWEPSMLELPSGELQLYFADESPYTTNGDQQISVCRSWDGGQTWSEPDCVSYRQGYRDGMPVPVLLADGNTIAVAIEDNGLGYGDFVPAIVRNTLTANWKNYVSGQSSKRRRAIQYDFCPVAKGGAPYLRVLPGGETILSHQSCYNHGDTHNMYVYVGNDRAMDFKAMSSPFVVPENQSALWNSLAVIDTGVVVAVSGFNGNINVVKGYPKKQFEVPYGSPVVDGRFTKNEGYYADNGRQIMMGGETNTFTYTDLAYDKDSLYLFCQVYDNKKVVSGEYGDGISFAMDTNGGGYNTLQATSFRYDIFVDGTISPYVGGGIKWTERTESRIRVVVRSTAATYAMEVAVPWSDMNLQEPPVGKDLSFNLEITNGDGTKKTVEKMADARSLEPWTWMPLNLHKFPDDTPMRNPVAVNVADGMMYDIMGRRVAWARKGLYITNGKKMAYK